MHVFTSVGHVFQNDLKSLQVYHRLKYSYGELIDRSKVSGRGIPGDIS